MKERFFTAFLVLVGSALVAWFVVGTQASDSSFNFKLGLDLDGGTHLVYEADTASTTPAEVPTAMESLRDVIERRVNLFGVSEPLVQVERSGVLGAGGSNRLIVELPGVTDVGEAVAMIGKTPSLEFKLQNEEIAKLPPEAQASVTPAMLFSVSTGLTGRMVKRAQLTFDPQTSEPQVLLNFSDEGAALFAKVTGENAGKPLAIFLDGDLKSAPNINEKIEGGQAVISGRFTAEEARTLVRDLNFGALPLPVSLLSTQSIGPTLGDEATRAGVKAGIMAFAIVSLFLVLWYRLPGVVASVALFAYVIFNLALFKFIPVTLTAAGIAGFVLSLGMAVDANILIFERMKEERKKGASLGDAVSHGFSRAWLSIRDSNLSSIITAVILYYFASSNVIRGFAFVFLIGVLVSMFTALTMSRTLLRAIVPKNEGKLAKFLFSCGLTNH